MLWFLTLLFGSPYGEKLFGSLSDSLFDLGRWFDNLLGLTPKVSVPVTILPPWSPTTAYIAALNTTGVRALTPEQIASLTTEHIQAFTTEGISVFLSSQLLALDTSDIAALRTDQVVALTTSQIPVLPTAGIAALTTNQIVAMEIQDVESLTQNQVMALTTAQIVALSTDQFPTLSTNEIAALSTAQVRAIETQDIEVLTTDQVVALTTAQLRAFTNAQVDALTPDQEAALQLFPDKWAALASFVSGFTTTQVAEWGAAFISTLTPDDIADLSTAQVMALRTDAIQALTTDQFLAIESQDIAVLSTDQIQGITSSHVIVMSTAQMRAFASEQIQGLSIESGAFQEWDPTSPIILDLNGDGVRTLGIGAGVKFDLFDDGAAIHTGWVNSGDGLLVLDRNHDGVINSGAELFGDNTRLANGEKASHGYAALRELDSNGDGTISSDDAIYGDLRIWIDSNSDGVSGTGETKTLAELGIAKINLNAVMGTEVDNGNWLGLTSSYETTDGLTHDMADVWFVANKTGIPAAGSVDSAIAALNTTTPVPSLAVDTVAAPQTLTAPTIQALPAAEPVPLTSAMRAQVSSMAQALGSFVEAGLSQSELAVASVDGGAPAPARSPVALAVSSLADAMKQFDVNGPALGGQSSLGVPTTTTLKFTGGQDPRAGDLLLAASESK